MNKEAVFQRMRLALEQVIEIVTDTRSGGEAKTPPVSIYAGIKDFKVQAWDCYSNVFLFESQLRLKALRDCTASKTTQIN